MATLSTPTINPSTGGYVRKAVVLALVTIPPAGTILAMALLWQRAVGWGDIALLICLYMPVSLGVMVGFHRYLPHRGFRAHPVVKAVMLVLGSMAIDGPALTWAANHRKHHAFPRGALHGLRWWQFDLSGLTVRLLARMRLAQDVYRVTADGILAHDDRRPVVDQAA